MRFIRLIPIPHVYVWLATFCASAGCYLENLEESVQTQAQSSSDENPRLQLLKRLEGKGEEERRSIILEMISDRENRSCRRDAIQYLSGSLAEASRLSKPLIALMLNESDETVANDLQNLLSTSEFQIDDDLLQASKGATDSQQKRVIKTLGLRKTATPECLAYLEELLQSSNTGLISDVCNAIVAIGPRAKSLLPSLINIASTPRVAMRFDGSNLYRESRDRTYAAIRAINSIGPDEIALSVLINALKMESNIAAHAAQALEQLGDKAVAAIPDLKRLSDRDDHGGKDVKTMAAKRAAENALLSIEKSITPQ